MLRDKTVMPRQFVWSIPQKLEHYDFYNGKKLYNALYQHPKFRSHLDDIEGKGIGKYAAIILNSYSGDAYSQSMKLLDIHLRGKTNSLRIGKSSLDNKYTQSASFKHINK